MTIVTLLEKFKKKFKVVDLWEKIDEVQQLKKYMKI